MPAGWVAAAGAIGSAGAGIYGALKSSDAASSGGQAINAASQNAAALQASALQQAQTNLAPYNASGQNALQTLQQGLGVGGYGNATPGAKTLPVGYHFVYHPAGDHPEANGAAFSQLYDASGNLVYTGDAQDATNIYGVAGPPTYDNTGAKPAGYGSLTTPFDQSAQGQAIASTGFVNGKPFDMSPEALAATPGYKFNLQQGLQATQNNAAARGLGVSGAALRSAADYATGLADSTWQSQANNYYAGQNNYNNAANTYYAGQNNIYNKLAGVAGLGENAAATSGNMGVTSTGNQANTLVGGATAAAAGNVGAANSIGALGTTVANATNSYQQNQLYQQLLKNSSSAAGNGMYTTQNGFYPAGQSPSPVNMSGTVTG